MDTGDYIIIVVGVGIAAFLWSLHRDMRGLGERLARLEGLVQGILSRIDGLDRRMSDIDHRMSGIKRLPSDRGQG